MPVWFEMGSVSQLTFGLIICFFSFGAYMMLSPYVKEQDDTLAQLCQTVQGGSPTRDLACC